MIVAALFAVAASAGVAQQLPPGTHSVDDHSRQNAVSEQISEAESALEKQDYKTAEAKLKVLAAANPKDGRVQYDLGFAEERNGEEADAAKAYAASIAAIPEFAEPKVALGLLDARAGTHRGGASASCWMRRRFLRLRRSCAARALRALAHLDETSNPEAAREELLAALKLTPETPDDVLMGAELADRVGDCGGCGYCVSAGAEVDAGRSGCYGWAGACAAARGQAGGSRCGARRRR